MLKRFHLPPILNRSVNRAAAMAAEGRYGYPFVIATIASKMFPENGTYQMLLSPDQPTDVGLISKDAARQIIKANGMQKVYTSSAGSVYEIPGEPFKKEYAGYYGTQYLSKVWSDIERDAEFPAECYHEEVYAYLDGADIVICGSLMLISFLQECRASKRLQPAVCAMNRLASYGSIRFQVV